MASCIDSNCTINYDRTVLNRKDEFTDPSVEWLDKSLPYSEWHLSVNISCWPLPLRQSCITSIADSCQSLMPMTTDPVTMHQKNKEHLSAQLESLSLLGTCGMIWSQLVQRFYNQSNLLYVYCVWILFCVIISYFLPNSIVLQKFFKARFFTLISRHFFWDDRNSHGDICEESHFFSKGLSIGVWAVSLQSLHISSHLFHHLLGPSVLFW